MAASTLSIFLVIFELSIIPDASVAFGAIAFPVIATLKTIIGLVPSCEAVAVSAHAEKRYLPLQVKIWAFQLKHLPTIGMMEMLFKPTSKLLTRAETVAMASLLLEKGGHVKSVKSEELPCVVQVKSGAD